jgi:hypothetical protein
MQWNADGPGANPGLLTILQINNAFPADIDTLTASKNNTGILAKRGPSLKLALW